MPHGIDGDNPNDDKAAQDFSDIIERHGARSKSDSEWIIKLAEESTSLFYALMTASGGDHLFSSTLSERFLIYRMDERRLTGR